MKSIIFFITLGIIIVIFATNLIIKNCERKTENNLNESLIFIVYYDEYSDEMYKFIVRSDKILESYMGTGNGLAIDNPDCYEEIEIFETTNLSDEEYNRIINLAEKINVQKRNTNVAYDDVWYISIFYKGEFYDVVYEITSTEEIDELLDIFIELSPIDVDIRGFS